MSENRMDIEFYFESLNDFVIGVHEEMSQKFSSILDNVRESLAHLKGKNVTMSEIWETPMMESMQFNKQEKILTVQEYLRNLDNEFFLLIFEKIYDFIDIVLKKYDLIVENYMEQLQSLEDNVKGLFPANKEGEQDLFFAIMDHELCEDFFVKMEGVVVGDDNIKRDLPHYLFLELKAIQNYLLNLMKDDTFDIMMTEDSKSRFRVLEESLDDKQNKMKVQLDGRHESLSQQIIDVTERLEQVDKSIKLLKAA